MKQAIDSARAQQLPGPHIDRNKLLLPLVLSEQIVPSSFAFALNYLIDQDLTLKPMDAQFKSDEAGVGACDPRTG